MPPISEPGSGSIKRDLLVGIRSIPLIKLLHALFEDGEIAIALIGMGSKDQRVQFHRAKLLTKVSSTT